MVTRKELDTLLEAANWAPTHQKTEPWRYTVFSGSEAIITYLDYIEDHYTANADTLDEAEMRKFRNKMSGARNTWVTNSSAVIVIGMKRHPDKLPEWEEVSAVAMSVCAMNLQIFDNNIWMSTHESHFLLPLSNRQSWKN